MTDATSDLRLYLDSSALVKLVLPEDESAALRAALVGWPRRVASLLVAAEVPRAVRRVSRDPLVLARARDAVDDLQLIALGADVISTAAALEPATLRTLDAIHLASALSLGASLGALVTYDDRLATAAQGAGMRVLRPA